jgi:hypothetical protein
LRTNSDVMAAVDIFAATAEEALRARGLPDVAIERAFRPVVAKLKAAAERHAAAVTQATNDQTLSDVGRTARQAEATTELRGSLSSLRAEAVDPLARRMADRRRALVDAFRLKLATNRTEAVIEAVRHSEIRARISQADPVTWLAAFEGGNAEIRLALATAPVEMISPDVVEVDAERRSREADPAAWGEVENWTLLADMATSTIRAAEAALR